MYSSLMRLGVLVALLALLCAGTAQSLNWAPLATGPVASGSNLVGSVIVSDDIYYLDATTNSLIRVPLGSARKGELLSGGVSISLSSSPLAFAQHPSLPGIYIVCASGILWANTTGGLTVEQVVGPFSGISLFDGRIRSVLIDLIALGRSNPVFWITKEQGSTSKSLYTMAQLSGTFQYAATNLDGAAALVQHPSTGQIYVGASNGIAHVYDPQNWRLADSPIKLAIGAGRLVGAALSDDRIYWVSDAGLGLETEVTLTGTQLRRVVFFPNATGIEFIYVFRVEAAIPYNFGAVFFFGGNTVARVNRANFGQVYLQSTLSSDIVTSVSVDEKSKQFFTVVNSGVTSQSVYRWAMHACDQLSCQQCSFEDDTFCGVCAPSRSCASQFECARNFSLSAWTQDPISCPALFSVFPVRSDSTGGEDITIVGNFPSAAEGQATITCLFKNPNRVVPSPHPAILIGADSIQCTVPNISAVIGPNLVQKEETWTVVVVVNSTEWGELSFVIYDCNRLTSDCSKCGAPEFSRCHFCWLDSGNCTALSCTSPPAATTGCPMLTHYEIPIRSTPILPILPSSPIKLVAELFWLDVDNLYLPPEMILPYTLNISGTIIPISLLDPAGRISINLRPFESSLNFPGRVLSALLMSGNVVVLEQSVTVVNCSSFTVCSTCLENDFSCLWCPQTLFGDRHVCLQRPPIIGSSACPELYAVLNGTTGCTRLATITPSEMFLDTYSGLNASIALSGDTAQATGPEVQCQWRFANGTAAFTAPYEVVSGNITRPTVIKCVAPPVPTGELYTVTLWNISSHLDTTEALDFLFYSCQGSIETESCFDCLSPRRAECRWCSSLSTCIHLADIACSSSDILDASARTSSCALISNSSDSTAGNRTLAIGGNFPSISSISNLQCQFLLQEGLHTSPAVSVGSEIACTTPPNLGSSQVGSIWLANNTRRYTNIASFEVYNCSSLRSCSDCTSKVACVWCAGGCQADSTCPTLQKTGCPKVLSVSPDSGVVTGNEEVTIMGQGFSLDPTVKYFCVFSAVSTAAVVVSRDSISCRTPPYFSGFVNVTIEVAVSDGPILPFSPDSVLFEFFSCPKQPLETSCNAACMAGNARCGWCVASRTCTSFRTCSSLWERPCLSVNTTTSHAAVDGNYTLTTSLTAALTPGLSYNEGSVNALFCRFGNTWTTRSRVSDDLMRVSCETPAVPQEQQLELNLVYRNTEVVSLSQAFSFVNCSRFAHCADCSRASFCGWCLDENRCTTESQCSRYRTENIFAPSACPSLYSLSPSAGNSGGGDQITLTGDWFIPVSDIQQSILSVKFGDAAAPLISISRNTIVVSAPPAASASSKSRTVNVTILWNNSSPFTSEVQSFTFTDAAAISPGAIGGISAAVIVVVIIVGLIVAFIVVRHRRTSGLVVRVTEPDYLKVAFGSDLSTVWKMPPDNYAKLERVLLLPGHPFQHALGPLVQPTEADSIAKSFMFISCSVGADNAVAFLKQGVSSEVAGCEFENTIFRNNTITSRAFKVLCKIVGIKWLWRQLARPIAELDALSGSASQDKSGGTSLIAINMEVDAEKMAEGNIDASDMDVETNSMQLALTCYKLFSAVRSSSKQVPAELRSVFVAIDQAVMTKFNSVDAVYKAVGGFLFLRFVCPALTAPQFYGLLDHNPNEQAQRQLILVSKVLQSLANLAVPGNKEEYMKSLNEFVNSNMNKMRAFYDEMRQPFSEAPSGDAVMPTDKVKHNALAVIWGQTLHHKEKLKQAFSSIDDTHVREDLMSSLNEQLETYLDKPRKMDK